MNNKWFKRLITILSVGTFALLLFPVFSVRVDGTEYLIRGLNLTEFSAWGSIVVMTPLIILALLYSHMSAATKTVSIIVTQCINIFGIYESFSKAKQWVESISAHYASPEPYLFVYAILVALTLIIFYLYNEHLVNFSFTNLQFLKNGNKR